MQWPKCSESRAHLLCAGCMWRHLCLRLQLNEAVICGCIARVACSPQVNLIAIKALEPKRSNPCSRILIKCVVCKLSWQLAHRNVEMMLCCSELLLIRKAHWLRSDSLASFEHQQNISILWRQHKITMTWAEEPTGYSELINSECCFIFFRSMSVKFWPLNLVKNCEIKRNMTLQSIKHLTLLFFSNFQFFEQERHLNYSLHMTESRNFVWPRNQTKPFTTSSKNTHWTLTLGIFFFWHKLVKDCRIIRH